MAVGVWVVVGVGVIVAVFEGIGVQVGVVEATSDVEEAEVDGWVEGGAARCVCSMAAATV